MPETVSRLVAATDFSEGSTNAALRAGFLARSLGLDACHLVHVLEPSVIAALKEALVLSFGAKASFRDRVEEAFKAQADTVEAETGIRPVTDFLEGRITSALPESLQPKDMLVMGATGSHRMREALLGCTALRLVHKCNVPVLITRTQAAPHYQNVLLATDFSPHSERAAALAVEVVPQERIIAVHAFQAAFEINLIYAGVADAVIQQYREKAESEACASMEEFLAPYPTMSSEVLGGYPPTVLLTKARAWKADLIVVGKQGQSLVSDLLLGSVTQRLLNEAECDVLIVP